MTRARLRAVFSPARVLVYVGVFAHGHATAHLLNGNRYAAFLSVLVGVLAFLLAVIVAD